MSTGRPFRIIDLDKIAEERARRLNDCDEAAAAGELNRLIDAKERGHACDGYTAYRAAYGGHKEILVWLDKNGVHSNVVTVYAAAIRGHAELVKFLHRDSNCQWEDMVTLALAASGCIEGLAYVCSQRMKIPEKTSLVAVAFNQMTVLKFLSDNSCRFHKMTYEAARRNANESILDYLKEIGIPDVPYNTCYDPYFRIILDTANIGIVYFLIV